MAAPLYSRHSSAQEVDSFLYVTALAGVLGVAPALHAQSVTGQIPGAVADSIDDTRTGGPNPLGLVMTFPGVQTLSPNDFRGHFAYFRSNRRNQVGIQEVSHA
jgi:hypothetical protein